MGKVKLIDKIKDIVYKIALPIFLWSINMPTISAYLDRVEQDYEARRKILPTKDTEF